MRSILIDVRPLTTSAAFRRLWAGFTIAQFGHQMTLVTVAFQIYAITASSFAVGLVGLIALGPLIVFGLYGGALSDAYDRRTVALVTATGLWVCAVALVVHAWSGLDSTVILYGIVAVQSAFFAVNNPARQAIVPRILPRELLPAGNALNIGAMVTAMFVGPLLGGLVIAGWGVTAAYAVEAVALLIAILLVFGLPRIPPGTEALKAPGWRSVVEGLGLLRRAPNIRMSFIADLCAMILAQPRALFPAVAVTVYAGGATTLGLLQAAPALGSVAAFVLSGWLGRVHRHGFAIIAAVVVYGLSVALVGVAALGWPGLLWLAVVFLAFSGAADMISAAYRQSLVQAAAPDEFRGRMQGLFTVVVVGGPRLGDFLAGSVASGTGEEWAMVIGGVACVVVLLLLVASQRSFLRYDARNPTL